MGQIAVKKIAFIGGGAMAKAIIKGIIGGGLIAPEMITVGEPTEAHARTLHEAFGVNVTTDNKEAVKDADLVIFAVKPQVAPVALVPELMAAMKRMPGYFLSWAVLRLRSCMPMLRVPGSPHDAEHSAGSRCRHDCYLLR